MKFESFVCLMHPKDKEMFRDNFCRDGALEKWLLSDSKCETSPFAYSKVDMLPCMELLIDAPDMYLESEDAAAVSLARRIGGAIMLVQSHDTRSYTGRIQRYANVQTLEAKLISIRKKDIPEDKHILKKPVFFGAALHDPTSPAPFTKASMAKHCTNCTTIDFNTSHWVLDEAPEEVNIELEKWLNGLGIGPAKL